MYTLFEMLLSGIAFALFGFFLGHWIGWNMCKVKMECDRLFAEMKEAKG